MYVIACVVLSVAIVRVLLTSRPAVRRRWCSAAVDHAVAPTGLPRHVALLHYELLVARTELRAALGMPLDRTIDLRGRELILDAFDAFDAFDADDDPQVSASRARLAQLWERHANVLGHAQDPRWHLQGRLDWVHVGPFGRQVVQVRASLGHDPSRWIAIRAHRRTGRASFGCGAGGLRIGGTIRAGDPDALVEVIAEALGAPDLRPVLAQRDGSEVSAAGGRRALSIGRWRLGALVPVAVQGWARTEPCAATVPGPSRRGSDDPLP